MNVCSSCHDRIHSNEIKIDGYKQTTNGIILEIEKKDSKSSFKLEETVKELRKQGKSYANILEIIKHNSEYETITLYKLKKILNI